ncbi:MAG: hypothetical protein IMF07_08230, partial [Proteobacteria bacterium]|nr:hypothetical protein [Pseudomonadota bacterium]
MKKIRDFKISTKFIAALAFFVLIFIVVDMKVNMDNQRHMINKEIKRWSF